MFEATCLLAQATGEAAAKTAGPGSGAVYLLSAATSCLCAFMLLRGYWKSSVRLLFWSGLCFIGLAMENLALYVDVVVVPSYDISLWRRMPGLVAIILLVYGLVWDSK